MGDMSWPAPELLPPPPSDLATSRTTDGSLHTDHRGDEWRRPAGSGLPAARWIALLGGALVLTAAAAVVVASWDAIGRTVRVIGLAAGTAGLLVGSQRLRHLAPTSSNIAAHVGTFLTATVGVAALSSFGVAWPGCLVAGGLVALSATAWQAGRWSPEIFRAAQVGAIALSATGLAELTATTGGLIASMAAVGLLVAGAERRAAGLALVAVLSPLLTAVAAAGIGAGTFERAGLVGERLSWSGPAVGLLASLVLAVVAHRLSNDGLIIAAAAAPVLGIVTGLAAVQGSAAVWLAVPALVVLAGELAWWIPPSDRFRSQISAVIDPIALTVGAAWIASPWAVREIDLRASVAHPWAIPAVVTALAMLLATYRWHRADHRRADLGVPSLLALGLTTVIALGAGPLATAPVAVAAVGAGAFASRHRAAVYVPGVWALLEIEELTDAARPGSWFLAIGLAAVLFAMIVAVRARSADARHIVGWVELGLVVAVGGLAATMFAAGHEPTATLVGVAVVGTMLSLTDPRWMGACLATALIVGLVATNAAIDDAGYDSGAWLGWASVGAGLVVVWLIRRAPLAAHAAASTSVCTATAFAAGRRVAVDDVIAGGMCAVAVLTGLALALPRRTPIDSAAVTAGVLLAFAGRLPVDPAWVSGIWVVLGLQVLCCGAAMPHRLVTLGGAAVTTAAAGSWSFTTDLDDWLRDVIAPADITIADVVMLLATLSTLAIGRVVRRTLLGNSRVVNSWVAYGAGLVIGGTWLVGVQLERDPVWAVPAAVTFGVAATGLGARYRLTAPLVVGTIVTVATTVVATGADPAAIPVWIWLAAGGFALLGTAVLIERTSKQDAPAAMVTERRESPGGDR